MSVLFQVKPSEILCELRPNVELGVNYEIES